MYFENLFLLFKYKTYLISAQLYQKLYFSTLSSLKDVCYFLTLTPFRTEEKIWEKKGKS